MPSLDAFTMIIDPSYNTNLSFFVSDYISLAWDRMLSLSEFSGLSLFGLLRECHYAYMLEDLPYESGLFVSRVTVLVQDLQRLGILHF